NFSGDRIVLDVVRVDGNVTIDGASDVDLSVATFGGNVIVSNSTNALLFDLGVPDAPGISGNLILTGDTGPSLVNVLVGGAINCAGNDPAPALSDVQLGVQAAAFHGQCSPDV